MRLKHHSHHLPYTAWAAMMIAVALFGLPWVVWFFSR
jgi:hypothetical protein